MNLEIIKRTGTRTVFWALLLGSGALWAGSRVVSGQWEYTTSADGETESKKFTVCMTAQEAAAFNGDSKTGRAYFEQKQPKTCTIKSFELQGNTMSYQLGCGVRSIENKVTFHGDTSEGVTITKAPDGTHTMHTKARRLGACP